MALVSPYPIEPDRPPRAGLLRLGVTLAVIAAGYLALAWDGYFTSLSG